MEAAAITPCKAWLAKHAGMQSVRGSGRAGHHLSASGLLSSDEVKPGPGG